MSNDRSRNGKRNDGGKSKRDDHSGLPSDRIDDLRKNRMTFLTKIQNLVTALNDLSTAVDLLPSIQTALGDFDTFLDTL
jgi:hypothetical protein